MNKKNGIILTLKELKDLGIIKTRAKRGYGSRGRKKRSKRKTIKTEGVQYGPKSTSDHMRGYIYNNEFNPHVAAATNATTLINQNREDMERLKHQFANGMDTWKRGIENNINNIIRPQQSLVTTHASQYPSSASTIDEDDEDDGYSSSSSPLIEEVDADNGLSDADDDEDDEISDTDDDDDGYSDADDGYSDEDNDDGYWDAQDDDYDREFDWYDRLKTDDAGNFGSSPGSDAFHMEGEEPGVVDFGRFSTPENPSLATHIANEIPRMEYKPDEATHIAHEVPPVKRKRRFAATPVRDLFGDDELPDATVEDTEDKGNDVPPDVTVEDEEDNVPTPEMQYLTDLLVEYQPNVKRGDEKKIKKADDDYELLIKHLPQDIRRRERKAYIKETNPNNYNKQYQTVNAKRQHFINTYRKYPKYFK